MSNLNDHHKAIIRHQTARYQRFGTTSLRVWLMDNDEFIMSHHLDQMVTMGLFEKRGPWPGTYGQVDYHITRAGLNVGYGLSGGAS